MDPVPNRLPRRLHAALIDDIAEDCGIARGTPAADIRADLEARLERFADDADRCASIGAMLRLLDALLKIQPVDEPSPEDRRMMRDAIRGTGIDPVWG